MSKHVGPYPGQQDDATTTLAPWATPQDAAPETEAPSETIATEAVDARSGQGDGLGPSETYVPTTTTGREVTCPECGAVATIAVNRRESHDFCGTCDFPLFWTPTQLVLGDVDLQAQAALRRLPGTAGRSTVGSLACPHCAEANPVSGVVCLRCGGDLHPVAAAPARVVAPAPEPEPEPEPTGIPWWWWALGFVTLVLLVLVVVVQVRGT